MHAETEIHNFNNCEGQISQCMTLSKTAKRRLALI